ncbi:MAG: S8 family peptidase, partial [Lentisphaerota bacterium]
MAAVPTPSLQPVAGNPAQPPRPAPQQDRRQIQSFVQTKAVLESVDQAVSGDRIRRISVVDSDFKYRYVRMEEIYKRDPANGAETLLDRRAMVADHVIVKLQAGASDRQLAQMTAKYGARIRKKMMAPDMYLVELEGRSADAVEKAIVQFQAETATIAWSEPDYLTSVLSTLPNDPSFNQLYGMHNTGQTGGTPDADIDAPEAWDVWQGSSNTLVGVIDTGVDYVHTDLAANYWYNPGETGTDGSGNDRRANGLDDDGNGFVDDYRGWDFYNDDNNPMDDHSHGSHCSGTIGGVGNNAVGVAGVCWDVSIVALKFLSGGGSGSTSDAIDAVYYGTRIGVKLTSNSWGGGGFSTGLMDAIEDASQHGILFIAAAGNDGVDNDLAPHYPSSYTNANIIAVAATDHSDLMAYFSCYGLRSVDLGAPGVNILSTVPGNGYSSFSGTSMATPHVAGAAALLWSLQPSATHTAIRDALFTGVDTNSALRGRSVTGGRLNVYKSLLQMKMAVIGSTPADRSVAYIPPTHFSIRLSDVYTPASVSSSDLRVNGQQADTVSLVDSNRIIFGFATSPVSTQGVQNMTLEENAITRLRDGDGIRAWNATFRYDAQPLQVTGIQPVSGSLATIPLDTIQLDWSESFTPASATPDDLVLNQGWVTGVTVVDTDTLEFAIAGITNEALLTIDLPDGALTDVYGNPSFPYSSSNWLDVGTVVFPGKLMGLPPFGSLVYEGTAQANVGDDTDTDAFTIRLDPGQRLAAYVTPSSYLQAALELRGPENNLLGQAQGVGPGRDALLAGVPAGTGGVFTLTVGGVDGMIGPYSLRVVLNADLENEHHQGPPNQPRGMAQNLDPAFMDLPGGGSRAAVLGGFKLGDDAEDLYRMRLQSGDDFSV